jgi:hypothetical protein
MITYIGGCLWLTVLGALVIGPLILFSDLGGMQGPNPVFEGVIKVQFKINSTLSEYDLYNNKLNISEGLIYGSLADPKSNENIHIKKSNKVEKQPQKNSSLSSFGTHLMMGMDNFNLIKTKKTKNIKTTDTITIYKTNDALIKTFNKKSFNDSGFGIEPETKFFKPRQV